jgi:phosphate-selective porin OprO/OprP
LGEKMTRKNLASAIALAIGGMSANPTFALDLYVDSKTKQIYAEPGPNRIKLGSFERVGEAAGKSAAAEEEIREQVKKEVEAATKDLPEVNTKGKLEFKSRDGNFEWEIGGRIHAQAGIYDNDRADDGTPTDFNDGADFRRARLNIAAQLWKHWHFKLEYDFAGSGGVDAGLRDAFISYHNDQVWPFAATVGQFKEYFGLESYGSSNDITFIERALPSRAFSPPDARRLGIGLTTHGHDLWTLGAGFYGKNASSEDIGGVDVERDDPAVFVGRATLSPIHTNDTVLHLGFAGSWLSPDNTTRFRERPELTPGTGRLIDTGTLEEVNDVVRLGAEAAGVFGPFSVQGEYIRAEVDRKALSDPEFDGWYVQGSWILTGESRIYDFKKGVFKNPKPNSIVGQGGYGAWEVAARYSRLDLNDADVDGGREENFTAGLNWYPTPNFKFMANYVNVLNVKGGNFAGAEPEGFLLRGQVTW